MEFEEGMDSFEEMMREKGVVWDEIVVEKELLFTKLEEVGIWWYVDFVFRYEFVLGSCNISNSMVKS